MADPTPTDVHTKKRAPGGAFLSRLYASLKERWSAGGFLSAEDFATVFRSARGHAGGKAKAEKLMAAEGDPSGVAVVLPVPPDVAAALALPDGLPAADLHLTICMLGDTETMDGVALAEALLAVRDAGLIAAPITARISGLGRFIGDTQDAIYLSVDSPDLNDLWNIVCEELCEAGIEVSDDHGFTPHITLAYVDPGAPSPLDTVSEQSITFDQLALWAGLSRTSVPLLGMGDDGDGDADGTMPPVLQDALGTDATGTPYEYLAGESRTITGHTGATSSGILTITTGTTPINIWATPIPHGQSITSGYAEVVQPAPASDLADLAAAGHTHRLFNNIAFAEAPEWIPYLPKPGVYAHPRYGPITITPERNARFVDNFNKGVYQDRLPIDAEHETKLSGAVGWITAMRQNADGSADAKSDWTDRGKAFFKDDRFRYFSPEWYDNWQRPETGEMIPDVAIGGALTVRPFFKNPALRPLFASEGSLSIADTDPSQGDDMPEEPQNFAELQAQLDALKAENATLKSAGESATAQSTQLAERLAAVETERQRERFTALIRNDGARWFGETTELMTELEQFAKTFGEASAEFQSYVKRQQATAAILRTSAAFLELGGDGGGRTENPSAKLDRMASERATKENIPYKDALEKVANENPTLYAQHSSAAYVRTKGAE